MKNILYILVTLALFSYLLAMPADDSDSSKAKQTQERENADNVVQKGKDNEKGAADKPNESAKGKQAPGSGLMSLIPVVAKVPEDIFKGFVNMGEEITKGFTNGLKQGMGESRN